MENVKNKRITLELEPILYAHLLKIQYRTNLENVKNGKPKITLRKTVLQCLNDFLLGDRE